VSVSILLVEDDNDVADAMMRGLSRHGHALERADNGKAAIERGAQLRPDVMVLDLGPPDIDGLVVCGRVRAGGYTGGVAS
jgi:DNA-binding response OmpR family regulator